MAYEKKYFLILQPKTFEQSFYYENMGHWNSEILDRIMIMTVNGRIIMNDTYNAKSFLRLDNMLKNEEIQFITYNGSLLRNMIFMYWKFNINEESPKIIDLMEEFAHIYKEETEAWVYEFYSPEDIKPYRWQKLEIALKYYNVNDFKVNIIDPEDVLRKTIKLYNKMYKKTA